MYSSLLGYNILSLYVLVFGDKIYAKRDLNPNMILDDSRWYLLELKRQNYSSNHREESLKNGLSHLATQLSYKLNKKVTINSITSYPNILVNFSTSQQNNKRMVRNHDFEENTFNTPMNNLDNAENLSILNFRRSSDMFISKEVGNTYPLSEEGKWSTIYVVVGGVIVVLMILLFALIIFCLSVKRSGNKHVISDNPFSNITNGTGRFEDTTQVIFLKKLEEEHDHDFETKEELHGANTISFGDEKSLVSSKSMADSINFNLSINTLDEYVGSSQSKSPFYEQQLTSTPRPLSKTSLNSRLSDKSKSKIPPRPPSRTDSLDPCSRVGFISQNSEIKYRSGQETTPKIRRYSAPAPRPHSPLLTNNSRPSSSASQYLTERNYIHYTPLDKEVIEEEVQSILENLGVHE